ncbi:uncharacterized protein PAC_04546 [Phialocephala subalpina]|uniref:DUF7053 domain-containing protein n=1 Tax=Phialocephala subalpina TaxID=576137 RepID=A0A1L7WPI8_9HELO|nr:uncharacterized protein PAC_04546 [Phialocephala subalpina]
MGKTIFTTITPLPAGVSRETVLETLHDHLEMIDLNPAHTERHRVGPPPEASAEEYHCTWYQITDKISYFPGYKGKVSFKACFHDLSSGVQIHVYAPMGLDIKEKWSVGGNAPGEPVQPAEIGIGAPVSGLYLREDVELKCNFMMTGFVKKQLKDALATLVARLVVKSQLIEAAETNKKIAQGWSPTSPQAPGSPPLSPPSTGGLDMQFPKYNLRPERFSQQTAISEMDGGQYQGGKTSPGYPPAQPSPQFQNQYPQQPSPQFQTQYPQQYSPKPQYPQQHSPNQPQYPQQHSPGIPPYNPAAYAPPGHRQSITKPPTGPHPYYGQNGYGPAELPS